MRVEAPQNHKKANSRIAAFAFSCIFFIVIKSFADSTTETLFLGGELSRKESRKLGGLNPIKAHERLSMLNEADEKALLMAPFLHYHKLKGTTRYSIDADSRKSSWRITFHWENAEMKDVLLVKIEDTH
jgi:plasmid maintenance system killer protein